MHRTHVIVWATGLIAIALLASWGALPDLAAFAALLTLPFVITARGARRCRTASA